MPAPFQRLTIDQFASVLQAFAFRRRITNVHMHHTWRPNHAMWKGHDSMVGMWRFHTQDRGFSDIAQHLTIDPQGFVWTGRNWNDAPASAIGHNGNGVAGAFMFETVGDFDTGRDQLQGAQRQAVLDVIALVQARFGLPPENLAFHNQMAAKSCPGTGIDYDAFLAELRAHRAAAAVPGAGARGRGAARAAARPQWPDAAVADHALVQRTVRLIDPDPAGARTAASATPMEELDYQHASEAAMLGAGRSATRGGSGGDAPTPEQIDALRPYVLNLRMGRFSSSGLMTSRPEDVDMIIHEHLRPAAAAAAAQGRRLPVVLYAHGGLVKESAGLATAQTQVDWWLANGVYPIHFVWETGLFETIKSLLERARSPLRQRGLGEFFTDRISDPLIEKTVRALQAERIWGGMKASAQLASAEEGGARHLLSALGRFIADGGQVDLHAVGHSAGAIFQMHLVHAAKALGLPSFTTLQLMAPAVRVDAFASLAGPLLGAGNGVDALTVFTMRRDFERADDCARIYRKSLLYLVSEACETRPGTRLLGLEDSLRADPAMRALFGLGQAGSGHADLVWSKSPVIDGRSASQAIHHGDFDNDAPTMNSVARRVLGLADADPLPKRFPSSASRGVDDPWGDTVDWPPEWDAGAGEPPPPPPPSPPPPPPTSTPAQSPAPSPAAQASGRRRALCVGIDNYAQDKDKLYGCINDAMLWKKTLEGLGFTVEPLIDPTRAALVGKLEQLIDSARAGDEIVFQYAGHGMQIRDLNQDEATGDSAGFDEALCPIDYASGAVLLDDDLGALCDRLAAGARLTIFADCCSSGTISRALMRASPRNARSAGNTGGAGTARKREITATPEVTAAIRAMRARGGNPLPPPRVSKVELLFSACTSREYAWESDGQGEFTLRATRLLAAGALPDTARALHQQVVDAFGDGARQHPQIEGPIERLNAPLFGGA